MEKNLARKGFISRDCFLFSFSHESTLSGVYLIIFLFSFFRIFTSFIVVSSLSLSLGSLVSKSFVRVYYFLKLVDARYREVLSRDIPVSSCCKLMM